MRFPSEFYELLRNRITLSDIVRQKVNLVRKGSEYLGLCPFHKEKTPSFTVNDVKRFYHCFGCAAHGDIIKFVSSISGLSHTDSVIKLAKDYGIELPRLTKEQKKIYEESDEIFSILELATGFFKSQLTEEAKNYLENRGINKTIIDEFDIGFAPSGKKLQRFFEERSIPLMSLAKAGLISKREDGTIYEIFHNRIIFPIRNIYSKVVGFGGRVIGNGLPKYLNSPETIVFKKNETLYGENRAIAAACKKNYSILVEGYLDVIALNKAGFEEVAASLGTAVTEAHIQKLWRAGDEIILCFDGDSAGVRASTKVIKLVLPLVTYNKKISFIQLPAGYDPDDIVTRNDPKFFQQLVDSRVSLSQIIWSIEYQNKNFTTAESKASLEKCLEEYCNQITDNVLRTNYRRFFKEQIWQNLISKHKNKVAKASTAGVKFEHNYSEIEMLEHALCSMLVKFPKIIWNEEAREFLLNINFMDTEFADFRDWFIENVTVVDNMETEKIEHIVEKTRFHNTFLLLLKPSNLFLDVSFNKKDMDPFLVWQWLCKKYHMILLRQEYTSIMKHSSDDALKKAILYQEEILKISNELQKLNEFITNH